MSTLTEIEAAISKLPTHDLLHLEQAVHQLYRERGESLIYDDKYDPVTESDLVASADQAFQEYDKEEAAHANRDAR
jgi:hypothetical protein